MSRRNVNRKTHQVLNVSWYSGPFRDLFEDSSWNSESFFLSCLKEERGDHEMNPLEDAIITRMYMVEYKTPQEMSVYLNRPERAINLRLRMIFDVLPTPDVISAHDKIEIAKFFRKRAEKFMNYCKKLILTVNPEHEVALLDDDEELLREALDIFLDVPEENHFL